MQVVSYLRHGQNETADLVVQVNVIWMVWFLIAHGFPSVVIEQADVGDRFSANRKIVLLFAATSSAQ